MIAWPQRMPAPSPKLDLTTAGPLTFEAPDLERFPALGLAFARRRDVPGDRAAGVSGDPHRQEGAPAEDDPALDEATERRVDEAARFVPMDRLGISPQCGFASEVGGNIVTFDDQMAKLDLTLRAADAIWGAD